MMKRLTAMLVVIAMLAALCGCGGGGEATTPPTTVPPTTTEPAPLAADVYAEANEKLAAMTNVQLDITYMEEMVLGADTFKSTTQEVVTALDLGKETVKSIKMTYVAENPMRQISHLDPNCFNEKEIMVEGNPILPPAAVCALEIELN